MAQHEVEKVEQHMAILKMAGTGPGLQDAVSRALAEPGLFVYGEIVDFLSKQKLHGTPQETAVKTLEMFAFGTLNDYRGHEDAFLPLNEQHLVKLKQLTLCTLAKSRVLAYDTLLPALGFSAMRELEDFIIQKCVYEGLLDCRFDQQHRQLHVLDVYKRDVPSSQLPVLTQGLQAMLASVQAVMGELQSNVTTIASAHTDSVDEAAAFKVKLEEARKSTTTAETIQMMDNDEFVGTSMTPTISPARPFRAGRGGPRAQLPDAKKSRK